MNILYKIIEHKKKHITKCKQIIPLEKLKESISNTPSNLSLKEFLLNPEKNGIIAEFKRKSPSKGILNSEAIPGKVALHYQESNVSATSVLTETDFFWGKDSDIIDVANNVSIPVLRKDFIIDEYQIFEAKSLGVSAILLIAAILSKNEMEYFYNIATYLNIDVLFEVHNKEDISKVPVDAQIVGINNRDLNTFKVDIDTSLKLSKYLPSDIIKVSESGISNINTIKLLKQNGFKGFLIGEVFMSHDNPGQACKEFCLNLNK